MKNRRSQLTTQSTQTSRDTATWELPDGAIARVGPGLIYDMAFSPDNASLAVGTRVGVWMYELDTMQPVILFETERGMISNVVLSPDGKWVATSNADGIIKVREIETQQRVANIQGWHGGTSCITFSPDSRYIAASGREYGDIYVWCPKTGQHVTSFKVGVILKEGETYPTTRFPICFSPDGQLLAYVSGWTTLTVRNLKTKERFAYLKCDLRESEYVYDLAFSPCGQFLAASLQDPTTHEHVEVQVWNIDKETLEATYTDYSGIRAVLVYSSDGALRVADVYEDKVVMWDASQGEKLDTVVWNVHRWEKQHAFIGHAEALRTAAFHPNGQQFATTDGISIFIWSVRNGEQLGSPSVDSTFVAVYKGDMRQIQRKIQRRYKSLKYLHSITFSPCGTLLAGGLYGGLHLWDAVTLEPRMGMILPESCSHVGVVIFSSCSRYLASGSWWRGTDKVSIRLWEVATGENIHTFWGHTSDVQNLAFSKEGELLASSSNDGTILLWDMKPYL